MRHIFSLLLIGAASLLASCASSEPAPSSSTSPSVAAPANVPTRFVLRNESGSSLTVQPFEASQAGGTRRPLGSPFIIGPGQTDSRDIGIPGRVVSVTIQASGQDIKYQSGEWVVTQRADGFRLYAFTDGSKTVRVNWNGRDGEEINMQ